MTVAMQDRISMISKLFTKSTGFGDGSHWLGVLCDMVGVRVWKRREEQADMKMIVSGLFNWILFIVTEKNEIV